MSTDKTDNENDPNTFVSVTGAALKCDLHGIETFDLTEWNEHCADPANGHYETGDVPCKDCGTLVNIDGHPCVPLTVKGKDFNVRCPECINKLVEQSNALRGANK